MTYGAWFWEQMLRTRPRDPQAAIMSFVQGNRSMWLGVKGAGDDPDLPVFTMPNTHLLTHGAPQAAHKTSATEIPGLVLHHGPAVVVTTKQDLFTETAMLRARLGRIWCYNPDPSLHYFKQFEIPFPPPGTTEVRWSPVDGCEDESQADYRADRTVTIGNMGGAGSRALASEHKFWDVNAKDLIAALFHWAALMRRGLDDVIRIVTRQEITRNSKGESDFLKVMDELRAQNTFAGNRYADVLFGLANGSDAETTANILASTRISLAPWNSEKVMRSTQRPTFKVTDFVSGRDENTDLRTDDGPIFGANDTLYIVIPERHQQRLAPMVVNLIMAIRDATHELFDISKQLKRPHARPVLMALDEMYNLGSVPDLIPMLSEGASQNVLLCGAIQSFEMARDKWGLHQGNALKQLFGHQLLAPGMLDDDVMAYSAAAGDQQMPTVGYSESWGGLWNLQLRWMKTIGWEWRPKLAPSDLYAGPQGEDMVWHFWSKGGWGPTRVLPYFKGRMLEIFMASVHHALRDPERAVLPLPELNQSGDFRHIGAYGGRQYVDWWSSMNSYHSQRALGGRN